MANKRKLTPQELEVFLFLNWLRRDGSINMFGARPVVEEMFGLDAKESKRILMLWMNNFNDDDDAYADLMIEESAVKMAKGGGVDYELKEDDFIWDKLGNKYVVHSVTDNSYFLDGYYEKKRQYDKNRIHSYLERGMWTLKSPYSNEGSTYAKGGQIKVGDIVTFRGQGKYEVVEKTPNSRTMFTIKDIDRGSGWDKDRNEYVGVHTERGWHLGKNKEFGMESEVHKKFLSPVEFKRGGRLQEEKDMKIIGKFTLGMLIGGLFGLIKG